jgi:hypothetical protein
MAKKLATKKYKQPTKKQQGETTMAGKAVKATVDFQLLDNGTVKFTISPVDSVGNATTLPAGTPPLTAVVSDPTKLTVAADPADTSGFGLSQIGTPTGQLATGITVNFSTTLPGATAPIAADSDAIDVVAGGPTGFKVTES